MKNKIVKLSCEKAKKYAEYVMHGGDMVFSLRCLDKIEGISKKERHISISLWYCALVMFFKCFSFSQSRDKLKFASIYITKDERKIFDFFKSLRDKHIAHDENSYTQSHVGAILNGPNENPKILDVIAFSLNAGTDKDMNKNLFRNVVKKALDWVSKERLKIHKELKGKYETISYKELCDFDTIKLH